MDQIEWNRYGHSVQGRELQVASVGGAAASPVLMLGVIHGDEPAGEILIRRVLSTVGLAGTATMDVSASNFTSRSGSASRTFRPLLAVPVANPDGFAAGTRANAAGVDLNRNFPTKNWTQEADDPDSWGGFSSASEPETQALIELIEQHSPAAIISIHAITEGRECNNYDGPAEQLAQSMGSMNGYPVRGTIGYPTPGSLGTWAGLERGIPVVTLELPADIRGELLWPDHREALLCGLEI